MELNTFPKFSQLAEPASFDTGMQTYALGWGKPTLIYKKINLLGAKCAHFSINWPFKLVPPTFTLINC